MSQEIQIGFVQEGDRYTIQTGSAVLGDIVMDYSGYPEDARGGNSSILLLSAALSCYCGSIRPRWLPAMSRSGRFAPRPGASSA